MSDLSATSRHHSQPRRQKNPRRREVCRVIQAEEGNLVRGGVSRINLEGSSSRGRASRKIATGYEPGQSVAGKRNSALE